MSRYSTSVQCARITFMVCNGVFLFLGFLGFIIGIWGVATSNSGNSDVITGNSPRASSAILLVSSMISMGIAAVGLFGALFMRRILLIIYAVVVGIVALLEFIASIISFAFINRAREVVNDNFRDAIRRYRVSSDDSDYDKSSNEAVELYQGRLDCCGVNRPLDWLNLNPQAVANNDNLPPGKCECDAPLNSEDEENCIPFNGTTTNGYVWKDGCLDILSKVVVAVSVASGVVSFIIMLIELTFMGIAIGLAVYITKTPDKYGAFV